MIRQFKLTRSRYLLTAVMVLHTLVITVSLGYSLSVGMKVLIITTLVASMIWHFYHEVTKAIVLRFVEQTSCWQLAGSMNIFQEMNILSTVCVNEWCVWLVVKTRRQGVKTFIIGRDCMPAERFLQLRRCILRPDCAHNHQLK